MSALPNLPRGFGYNGLRMTARAFRKIGETDERYELCDGIVVMSPSPHHSHSAVVIELIAQIATHDREGRLYPLQETDLSLNDKSVYRPDLMVYLLERFDRSARACDTPPAWIVEVLSPDSRARDFVTKRRDYESFGVGEYWVIDPADASVTRWQRRGRRFAKASSGGKRLGCAAIPGLFIDVPALRRRLGLGKPGRSRR